MSQTNEEKLNDVQKRLDDLGLSDVKIHFYRESLKKLTRDELYKHVSHVFHTYLNGERVPLELFGDSNGRGI